MFLLKKLFSFGKKKKRKPVCTCHLYANGNEDAAAASSLGAYGDASALSQTAISNSYPNSPYLSMIPASEYQSQSSFGGINVHHGTVPPPPVPGTLITAPNHSSNGDLTKNAPYYRQQQQPNQTYSIQSTSSPLHQQHHQSSPHHQAASHYAAMNSTAIDHATHQHQHHHHRHHNQNPYIDPGTGFANHSLANARTGDFVHGSVGPAAFGAYHNNGADVCQVCIFFSSIKIN